MWPLTLWGGLTGTSEDQAHIRFAPAVNNDDVLGFSGPCALDRTHMLSVGSLFRIPGGIHLNSIWRFSSAFPQSVFVPQVSGSAAEIFYTDFNGDGTYGDPLPGTRRGSFGRDIGNAAALNRAIDSYNSTQAGQLTPAGKALVNAGLFTEAQLKALGAVSPRLQGRPRTRSTSTLSSPRTYASRGLSDYGTNALPSSRPWKSSTCSMSPTTICPAISSAAR